MMDTPTESFLKFGAANLSTNWNAQVVDVFDYLCVDSVGSSVLVGLSRLVAVPTRTAHSKPRYFSAASFNGAFNVEWVNSS